MPSSADSSTSTDATGSSTTGSTGGTELDLDDDRSLDGASGAGHCEVRRVSNAGSFRFAAVPIFLSQALNGEYIALEGSDDGLWNILFYSTLLGRFDRASGKITGADFRTEQGRNP